MADLPDCLQPAAEQLEKYEVQIAALESKNSDLSDNISKLRTEQEKLQNKIEEEAESSAKASQQFETEKLTLREINVVVSNQLRQKVEELNKLNSKKSELEAENSHIKNLNNELSHQNTRANSDNLLASVSQEALAEETAQMSEELKTLRTQNKSLKDENSALTLVNSAMHQRQEQASQEKSAVGDDNDSALVGEIERLKRELDLFKNDNSDEGFLRSENERLIQRHGEITQEKMQASAKMHLAQSQLNEIDTKLETTRKSLKQLEFEHQGLENLHKNLAQERTSLAADNDSLVNDKAQLEEKLLFLGETIQRITAEKEMVVQELSNERIKADAMIEEVNHLRMKSRTLAENIKGLRVGMPEVAEDMFDPQVQALEIDVPEDTSPLEVEIVTPSKNSEPHYPGKFHNT